MLHEEERGKKLRMARGPSGLLKTGRDYEIAVSASLVDIAYSLLTMRTLLALLAVLVAARALPVPDPKGSIISPVQADIPGIQQQTPINDAEKIAIAPEKLPSLYAAETLGHDAAFTDVRTKSEKVPEKAPEKAPERATQRKEDKASVATPAVERPKEVQKDVDVPGTALTTPLVTAAELETVTKVDHVQEKAPTFADSSIATGETIGTVGISEISETIGTAGIVDAIGTKDVPNIGIKTFEKVQDDVAIPPAIDDPKEIIQEKGEIAKPYDGGIAGTGLGDVAETGRDEKVPGGVEQFGSILEFSKYDSNGDGVIDFDEWSIIHGGHEKITGQFHVADINGDKQLEQTEFQGATWYNDADGPISGIDKAPEPDVARDALMLAIEEQAAASGIPRPLIPAIQSTELRYLVDDSEKNVPPVPVDVVVVEDGTVADAPAQSVHPTFVAAGEMVLASVPMEPEVPKDVPAKSVAGTQKNKPEVAQLPPRADKVEPAKEVPTKQKEVPPPMKMSD